MCKVTGFSRRGLNFARHISVAENSFGQTSKKQKTHFSVSTRACMPCASVRVSLSTKVYIHIYSLRVSVH